jgi:hypothetical protein
MSLNNLAVDIFPGLGIVGLAVTFFFYQIRRNDLKLLRDSIKDLTERVDFLEKENTRLKVDYQDIKFKKNYLKQIVLEALQNKADIKEMLEKSLINHNV